MSDPLALRARFGLRFSLLARRWRRVLDARLAQVGLTDATWVPLVHLKESGGGITQKDLAARVGVDGSSLVRVIDILSREGLVERRRDETDGRARLVHLTRRGEQRLAGIRRELAKAEEAMLADLSDPEIAAMLAHLETIERRITTLERAGTKDAAE
ncbi:MarR family winged helix-turn-helix transcriptional regulator [Paracoccus sp. MC1862]|uniref:MarR family winged helix-turn-helix transcriptional regulator n=1 Tax=Paracoccus sp. MC1862 TaxID=2760307 RepID=UPI00190AA01F|nr:MarR family transcriptional regulator [Paracoccus sp. MC1862]QQO46773.1 MarR family transcriptional regulator [Paracoccus sp. MC1862]